MLHRITKGLCVSWRIGRILALSLAVAALAGWLMPRSARAGEPLEQTAWWPAVQENIRQMEYEVTWQEQTALPGGAPAYHMANRAQNLRLYFEKDGFAALQRTAPSGDWQWRLTGLGRAGNMAGLTSPSLTVAKNRIEYASKTLTERYENKDSGIEQTLVLAEPPAGEGPALLRVQTAGLEASLAEKGNSLQVLRDGQPAIRYGSPVATDATGKALPVTMSLSGSELTIEIADAGAAYPVSMRATLTGNGLSEVSALPDWTALGNAELSMYGLSLATAGDVNGDGYSDAIVGALNYDDGQAKEGRAFVYYGSAAGLSTTPSWFAESNVENAILGCAVSTAGDVNGDGYSDVLVGASDYNTSGTALLWLGSASGLGANGTPANADWQVIGTQNGGGMGAMVATAGDVNGDGYADIMVTESRYVSVIRESVWSFFFSSGEEMYHMARRPLPAADEYQENVYVYFGSPSGPAPAPSWTASSGTDLMATVLFGYSIGTAGDVNGDGYGDIIISSPLFMLNGRVFVWYGSAEGLGEAGAPHNADWEAIGSQADSYFGVAAATAGDVNGDGYADIIVGAHMQDNGETNEGAVYVYQGSAEGLGPEDGTPGNADWSAESNMVNCQFGVSAGTAGDVNGDGYADVVVGAWRYTNGQALEGAVCIWNGSASGLGDNGTPANVDWSVESNRADALFGTCVATAGDVNGDGYSDILAGAIGWTDHYLLEGAAAAYHGGPDGLKQTPGWTTIGTALNQLCGYSVATAGDVNGDGYADVLVGAPQYDGGQSLEGRVLLYMGGSGGLAYLPVWTGESNRTGAHFGSSVATAGDVNGDGYSDIIVGAKDATKSATWEGTALLWQGSPAGMGAPGTPDNADWGVYGFQGGALLGSSVGTAGDVNGDGYSDIIIGAPGYSAGDSGEGAAFIWLGSSEGIDRTSGEPSAADWMGQSNQAGAQYGYSVGTAGDVNGDGLSDFIVGAPKYSHGETEEGAAFVYHGSRAGLSDGYNWRLEGNQAGALLGVSVATAGDVNGDGYADVIVGASAFDGAVADEGRAFVCLGSAGGLAASPSWWAASGQANSYFGASVASLGDVDGDGFADVAVGAWQYSNGESHEGKVFAYYGSASGPSLDPDFESEGNQADAVLGFSVASAGDVNGDGCADLIVGAPSYDVVGASVGAAFLCYGSGGRGLSLNPRQTNTRGAPVGRLGVSDNDGFTLALNGRTPFGRAKVRMECEVKPLGAPFDGSDTQMQDGWHDTGTGGTALSQTVLGLATTSPFHWRVRLHYQPASAPYQPQSRWLTVPWGGWNETMLFTFTHRNGVASAWRYE